MKKSIILLLLVSVVFLTGFAPLATTTLTLNPQFITVPANTSEHDINFDDILYGISYDATYGTALIQWVSGTGIQFNVNGQTITSASPTLSTTVDKLILPIKRGTNLRYKGGAGSETFIITIISK